MIWNGKRHVINVINKPAKMFAVSTSRMANKISTILKLHILFINKQIITHVYHNKIIMYHVPYNKRNI